MRFWVLHQRAGALLLNDSTQNRINVLQMLFSSADMAFHDPPAPTDNTAKVTMAMPAAAIAAWRFQPFSSNSTTTVHPINSGQY
jgi:hypothetical protein